MTEDTMRAGQLGSEGWVQTGRMPEATTPWMALTTLPASSGVPLRGTVPSLGECGGGKGMVRSPTDCGVLRMSEELVSWSRSPRNDCAVASASSFGVLDSALSLAV
eukprot:scaffold670402_cov46-Prasinocladus_malaysianus.AAC.1